MARAVSRSRITARIANSPHDTAGALRFRVAGLLLTVAGLPRARAKQLAALLAPFQASPDGQEPALRFDVHPRGEDDVWVVERNSERIAAFSDADLLLTQLEWHAIAAGLTATTDQAVFHAGALSRDGTAMILLGQSGVGKTTLTTGLIQRGWLPYADDVTLLGTRTATLEVFPRCFHMDAPALRRAAAAPPFTAVPGLPEHARPLRWAPPGLAPTAIVVIERDAHGPSTMRPISQAEAAAALLGQAMANTLPRAMVAEVAVRAAAGARACRQLTNGDREGALDLLDELGRL
ncbi:MAG TPA: hypothetical protein VFU88_20550 [Ktedonobacterales bacterium]|nr:hypothetical protein [Ktedonobacterales bacterium]